MSVTDPATRPTPGPIQPRQARPKPNPTLAARFGVYAAAVTTGLIGHDVFVWLALKIAGQ